MATIIQTADNTYTANNGKGTELTLVKMEAGYWLVSADNAAARAWRSIGKCYEDLAAVEAKYKTFRGISALIN